MSLKYKVRGKVNVKPYLGLKVNLIRIPEIFALFIYIVYQWPNIPLQSLAFRPGVRPPLVQIEYEGLLSLFEKNTY